ncbi:MAG: DUF1080 domain-containing protein [bacterium]|nr:DUF1080 domain-containing protein [bacterium]
MKTAFVLLLLASVSAFAQDYRPLFNGENLDGWDGDPRLWRVEDGVLIGSTEGVKLTDNTFLITKRDYSNFHLRLEVKLRNHNSGVQFRSEALPNWVVRGLQADIAQGNWWGSIYDEKGTRGVIVNGWTGKAEHVVKQGEWNDFEVLCQGDLIQIRINGSLTAELRDSSSTAGVIALQLHRGPAMEVRFRNIRIKELTK